MPGSWQRLPQFSLPKSVPPLLVKFETDGSGYTIYLTDLTYLWSESLDYGQIIQRSLDEETTIEPKEDADQFKALLSKIQQGLQGSDGSRLALLHGLDRKNITLRVSASLPPPFRPLQWPIYLILMGPEVLRTELLEPLLFNQAALNQQVDSLLVRMREKDSVITKLSDKLESAGIDMTMIFPGATGVKGGRRGLGREGAAKVVHGLADFNEDSWRQEMARTKVYSGDDDELLLSTFPTELPPSMHTSQEHQVNNWWYMLDSTANKATPLPLSAIPFKDDRKDDITGQKSNVVEDLGDPTELDLDDEFERQATPPALKNAAIRSQPEPSGPTPNRQRKSNVTDRGTSEESNNEEAWAAAQSQDLRSAVVTETVPERNPHVAPTSVSYDKAPPEMLRKAKKLGLVGGREHPTLLSVQPATISEIEPKSGVQGSRSETKEDVLAYNNERAPQPFPPLTSASTTVKHWLGGIGGKRQDADGRTYDTHPGAGTPPTISNRLNKVHSDSKQSDCSTASVGSHDEEHQKSLKSSRNLSSTSISSRPPPGHVLSPQKHTTPPPENSQERADMKRAELKRLLEEKAKATTHKRRRF